MLIHNGSTDEVVAIPTHGPAFFRDLRKRTIKLLGSNKNVFDFSFTPNGGHRPYFITRPVAEWLNKKLHFPDWNAISHSETKIGYWAAIHHVPMDRLYATEHREAGTIALGKGIPYILRDKLNVLPESEWQNEKNKFVLEAWYSHVRQVSTADHVFMRVMK
jgi:hypothetical protein